VQVRRLRFDEHEFLQSAFHREVSLTDGWES
jgi:hypothetical protein